MCGIAGIISSNSENIQPAFLKKMADALAHRGPDGEGFWQNKSNICGFAHRRLSILDLSESSAQPLHYLQRFTIVYNGALYNYLELRNQLILLGHHFHSTGDTEVIVAAFAHYGANCLEHFDGMYSFAIWDESEQQLFCARDRFGEKPFYYHHNNEAFYFASEMKGLWAADVPRKIEDGMMSRYLALGYVQNPEDSAQTFYMDIFSLPPGTFGFYTPSSNEWYTKKYFVLNAKTKKKINDKDAINITSRLLEHSVKMRMRSDVPLGSSLSGGLDSSAVLFFLQKNNTENTVLNTYSACYPGFEKDESFFIDLITSVLNEPNEKVYPNAQGMINEFEKICYHQEEPFPSSSIYAQYKVFEAARKNGTKVLLDGQGADEIFAGYTKYIHWYLQEKIRYGRWGQAMSEIKKLKQNKVPFTWGIRNYFATVLPAFTTIQLERREHTKLLQPHFLNAELIHKLSLNNDGINKPTVSRLNDVLHFNVMENGLEELLRYADRNSMAHGVEVRLPYLNKELVKFAFSLPSAFKIKNGYTKNILRKAMAGKLPDEIVWRKDKVGFETPQKEWMQVPEMKEYLQESIEMLVKEKYLDKKVLNKDFRPADIHAPGNEGWRIINAATVLKK